MSQAVTSVSDVETFVLGLVGTVLSVASLTWQMFSWRASGARLRVRFTWGIPVGTPGPAVQLRGITVTNRGRASTIVSGVTTRLPNGHHLPLLHDALDQVRFPREVRPGESITVYYAHDAVEHVLVERGLSLTTPLTPEAASGHGDVRGDTVRAG